MKQSIRLLIALFMLSGLRQTAAQVSFAPATNYAVGEAPFFALAADLNGDGYLDLISANSEISSLSLLTNNDNGVFSLAAPLNVGSMPYCAVAADIDGDGKLDLITPNINNNTLSVVLNTSIFPPPAFTPALSVSPQGRGVLVSWPTASAGWSLQQSSSLAAGHWLPSGYGGYGIFQNGTNYNLLTTPPTGNLYFRLMHP